MMATMVQKVVDLWNEESEEDDEQSILEESTYMFDRFVQNEEYHEKDDKVIELVQKILSDPPLRKTKDITKMLQLVNDKILNLHMYRSLNGLILRNACTINPVSDFHVFLKRIGSHTDILDKFAEILLPNVNSNMDRLPQILTSPLLHDRLTVLGSGPFTLHNCCNHSCEANCTSVSDQVDHRVRLIATQPILEGDPITISYIEDETELPIAERKRLLMQRYSFECMCTRCKREQQENKAT
jgi:hypothetical protein